MKKAVTPSPSPATSRPACATLRASYARARCQRAGACAGCAGHVVAGLARWLGTLWQICHQVGARALPLLRRPDEHLPQLADQRRTLPRTSGKRPVSGQGVRFLDGRRRHSSTSWAWFPPRPGGGARRVPNRGCLTSRVHAPDGVCTPVRPQPYFCGRFVVDFACNMATAVRQ